MMFVGVFPIVTGYMSATVSLAPGLSVLFVNLTLAILVREKIHHNLPLLIFHIALLLIILSVSVSRLTYFKGWAIVSEGEILQQPTGIINEGPWHKNRLTDSTIRQLEFEAYFDENGRRLDTESWMQLSGYEDPILVSNKETANVGGYQITISNNLGYSVDLSWIPERGDLVSGLLQLPSQISQPETQAVRLDLPGVSETIWIGLEVDSNRKSFFYPSFSVPKEYHFIVDINGEEYQLKPGNSINIVGGTLSINTLVPWIGYEMYYDPAIYFLLIASIVAVLSLGYFLNQRLAENHWIQENEQ